MSQDQIIRAWKDEQYRLSLTDAERAVLPENPAGVIDLDDAELDAVAGGMMKSTAYCNDELVTYWHWC
jgi:mersacidin/lichenicidin family type 2 lantibiotic